jgi:hypothetical protein
MLAPDWSNAENPAAIGIRVSRYHVTPQVICHLRRAKQIGVKESASPFVVIFM